MNRYSRTNRLIAALIVLALAGTVFVALGRWQLDRAAERTGIAEALQAGRQAPAVELRPDTPAAEFVNWRPAHVTGEWLDRYTVLLENRNYNGRPGFWVATPMLMDPARNTAVLVLRGWLPRSPGSGGSPVAPATPDTRQTIQGEMLDRVPRLLELWSSDAGQGRLPDTLPLADHTPPKVQNLDLQAYERATGLDLLPVVVEQTSDSGDGLNRDWPAPSIDADRNRGYALQWFSFAAIAALAWIGIAWRLWRGPAQP